MVIWGNQLAHVYLPTNDPMGNLIKLERTGTMRRRSASEVGERQSPVCQSWGRSPSPRRNCHSERRDDASKPLLSGGTLDSGWRQQSPGARGPEKRR